MKEMICRLSAKQLAAGAVAGTAALFLATQGVCKKERPLVENQQQLQRQGTTWPSPRFEKNSQDQNSPKLSVVETINAPSAIGPYSQGMKSNGFLYTSGQIAMRPQDGKFMDDLSIEEQCELALSNLNAVLEAADCSKHDVVKTTVFLQDMNDFQRMNGVYAQYFDTHKPARSAVEVSKLPKGAKVEIEAIARLPTRDIE